MRSFLRLLSFGVLLCTAVTVCYAETEIKSSSLADIELSVEEQNWLAANPVVRVAGDISWPPFNYSQHGVIQGFSIDYMNLLAQKTSLKVKYVNGPTWDQFLGMMKAGSLDIMLDIVRTPEREKYLNFTRSYADNPNAILSKKNVIYRNLEQLSGKTVAVTKGFFYENLLASEYPDIKVLAFRDTYQTMLAVSTGQADAALGEIAVLNHFISESMMTDLSVSAEVKYGDQTFSQLNIATRKDLPVLASILDKGMAAITQQELKTIKSRWLFQSGAAQTISANMQAGQNNTVVYFLVLIAGIIFVILIMTAFFLPKQLSDEVIAYYVTSRAFTYSIIFFVTMITMIIALLVWYTLAQNRQSSLNDTKADLTFVLRQTSSSLDAWIDERRHYLSALGQHPEIIELTRQLLTLPKDKQTLIHAQAQKDIRHFFAQQAENFGRVGFFLINKNRISIASQRNANLGVKNLIAVHEPELLNRAFHGETVFVPPIPSDVKLQFSESDPSHLSTFSLFFIAPVKDKTGAVLAVLTQRLSPGGRLSQIMQQGSIGRSGESYLINQHGRMITESRFKNSLVRIGLKQLNSKENTLLMLKDPGGNLTKGYRPEQPVHTLPFTEMAKGVMALSKQKPVRAHSDIQSNLQGYRDYRGVSVLGVWMWDHKHGIGITTEIDEDEALSAYQQMRFYLIIATGTALLLAIAFSLLTVVIGQRATVFMRRSNEELEERVNERTSRLSSIIDNAADGIVVIDHDGNIIEFSPAASDIFGYSAEEIYGINITRLLSQEAHALANSFLFDKSDGDVLTRKQVEVSGLRRNGDVFPLELSVSEVRLSGKNFFTGIIRDITDRKEAEQKQEDLLRELNFQKYAMDQHAIVSIGDQQGNITYVNEKFCEISGYTEDELIGKNHQLLSSGVHGKDFYQHMWRTISSGETWRGEVCDARKDGSLYWISASIVPLMGENGPERYVSISTDISQRKQAEEEIRQARDIAEEATRAKSDFLANMSHEIRTPMNAIIGMSHLAKQTSLDRQQRDYLNKIHGAADSLLGIINDILDFSKIEAGKLEIEYAPFSLRETLENLIHMITIKSREKGLELLIDVHPDVPDNLIGDSLRLGQILINLANNAVKFTEEGEIVIRIEKVSGTRRQVTLQFTVTDTGIGLTQAQQNKLFRSFSQADASTTRKYGGTGLGLSICKKLTDLMGGSIRVVSRYGEGSSFIFTVNFDLSRIVSQPLSLPRTDLRNLLILIVDDSPVACQILSHISESLTFQTEEATSGADALKKIKQMDQAGTPYQIVFIDWKMPGMDGLETSRRIQSDPELNAPPKIVIVTAYDRDELNNHLNGLVISGFLSKPVSPSSMLDATMIALGYSSGVQETQFVDLISEVGVQDRDTTILLVEDNEINQQVASELLEMAGYGVDVAEDGLIATEKVRSRSYDAVLMDVQMPVMDGYTATREIRKDPANAGLPVIGMTANAMAGDREKCLDAGMDDYISKPIDPELMFKILEKWVQHERQPAMSGYMGALNEETVKALPVLPGVDLELGLKRVAGKHQLYLDQLKRFASEPSHMPDEIQQALVDGDRSLAERLAHTLKGLSGNIGATELQGISEKLESAIRENNEVQIESVLPGLREKLQILTEAIQTSLSQGADITENSLHLRPIDAGTVDLLNQLRQLLADDDGDALDMFSAHYEQFTQRISPEDISRMEKYIDNFDFIKALDVVDSLLENKESSHE